MHLVDAHRGGDRLTLSVQGLWRGEEKISGELLAEKLGQRGAFVAIEPGKLVRNGRARDESRFVAEDLAEVFGD